VEASRRLTEEDAVMSHMGIIEERFAHHEIARRKLDELLGQVLVLSRQLLQASGAEFRRIMAELAELRPLVDSALHDAGEALTQLLAAVEDAPDASQSRGGRS
jgi:hypothetical protein